MRSASLLCDCIALSSCRSSGISYSTDQPLASKLLCNQSSFYFREGFKEVLKEFVHNFTLEKR